MLDETISTALSSILENRFMDSSGIGVLLNRYKQMAASRGTVTYYGAGREWSVSLKWAGWCV